MEFKYKAKKSLNEVIEGRLAAETLESAVEQLLKQGIIPISVEPQEEGSASKKERQNKKLGKWGLKKAVLFTQKLYNLVKSRVELLTALKLLAEETNDSTEKMLLDGIIKNIRDGQTFSQCLSRYPQYFSLLYINIVRTGESSGQLKDAFAQLLEHLRSLEELRLKVRQALVYPVFMVVVGICTIFVMLTFIFPRLVGMFEDFQTTLPLPTRMLLGASTIFRKYWIVLSIVSIVLFFLFKRIYNKRGKVYSYIRYNLPFVKNLVYKQAVANFSASLSLLLKSGVDLLSALSIAAPVIDNPKYINQLKEAGKEVKEGAAFSHSLMRFRIFPQFFIQMIRVGEEGGRIDSVLSDIADSYRQEIESDLKIVGSLLEPVIILILGLIIGGMVIAVLLPIFNINALIG